MAHTTNAELELDKLVEDMREDIRKKVNLMHLAQKSLGLRTYDRK